MTTISSLWIIACWIIFVGYWILSAAFAKPTLQRQSWLSMLAHRFPIWVGCVLLWYPVRLYPFNLHLTPNMEAARITGVVLCQLGLLVAVWSRWTLAGNWSANVTIKKEHELIKTGPYRFVRHPIYTGILMMCLGTAAAGARLSCWLGFLSFCFAFWIKMNQEESLMLQHFPDSYPAYRRSVKAIVPFLI